MKNQNISYIIQFVIVIFLFSYLTFIFVTLYNASKSSPNCALKTSHNNLMKSISSEMCLQKIYGKENIVCVCNSTFCDVLNEPDKMVAPNYVMYTSNKAGSRFERINGKFESLNINVTNTVYVNSNKTFQKILGFGGAITDSAGFNIKELSEETQRNLMRSYFGKNGIGYSFIRIPIGASDFSLRAYTYDDSEKPDPDLIHFKLAPEDYNYKIPFIHEAIALTNDNIKIVGTTWTCPKWMKTLPEYSVPLGEIKEDMYQTWANYHKKFLDAYKENNISIWGLSTGNEPTIGFIQIVIPNVAFTPKTLSNWIANNLGPTLRNSEYSDVKIIALDEQRAFLPMYLDIMFKNPRTFSYVDGIGAHWYSDKIIPTSVLQIVHNKYPDKFILGTELCRGNAIGETRVILGLWERGEDYAVGMIENLNNWFVGWIDWNIALDETGGPSYFKMGADSPIIINKTSDEFYKQPMFYVMGHFSKFVLPDSIRIEVSQFDRQILTIGFQRPDGGIAIIIVNVDDFPVDITIVDKQRGQQANLSIRGRSISTFLYW